MNERRDGRWQGFTTNCSRAAVDAWPGGAAEQFGKDRSATLLEPILDECEQLRRVVGNSITTSRAKADERLRIKTRMRPPDK